MNEGQMKAEKLLNELLDAHRITRGEYAIFSIKQAPIPVEQMKQNMDRKEELGYRLSDTHRELAKDTIILTAAAMTHEIDTYGSNNSILDDNTKAQSNRYLRVHDLLVILNEQYGCSYAENSREVIRKGGIKPLLKYGLIEDNGMGKTSPQFGYRATEKLLNMCR